MIRSSRLILATLLGQSAAPQMRLATGWNGAVCTGLECADRQQKPSGQVRCDLEI